jgi:hypothetical protein
MPPPFPPFGGGFFCPKSKTPSNEAAPKLQNPEPFASLVRQAGLSSKADFWNSLKSFVL